MYLTYKIANFTKVQSIEQDTLFEADLSQVPNYPHYIEVV